MKNKKVEFCELFFSKTNDFFNVFLAKQICRSEETIRAYQRNLSDFFSYITEVLQMNVMAFRFIDCTYELVQSYSLYLRETRHLSNSTVNQRLAAIKSYLKYVADCDISYLQTYISVEKVPALNIVKRQRPVIEKDGLKTLLNEPADTRFGNRDRMILILLFDTAIRVSELTAIVMGDLTLDVSSPSILIHGKGRKERTVTLSPQCAEHMRSYIKHYHAADEPSDTPLFYTITHGIVNHMSQRNVERIVKKYGNQAREENPGMPENTYPHMLRRSRATGMYRDGIPLEMISVILGHANLETTRIYAIPSIDQMRGALQKGLPEDDSEPKLWSGHTDELKRKFGLK